MNIQIKNFIKTRRKILIKVLIWTALPVVTLIIFAKLYPFDGVGEWTGIGKDSNETVTIEEEINPKTKQVIKITKKKAESFQSAKTLWDWVELLGVVAIPLALFYFEQREQRRSDKRARGEEEKAKQEKEIAEHKARQEKEIAEHKAKQEKEIAEDKAKQEKEIADNNLHEQVLEAYIDRMSDILIDKRLKNLLLKHRWTERNDDDHILINASLNIVRARTLSVLRKLNQDKARKGNIIRFLIDVELITILNLSEANLSGADLSFANLDNANLNNANLSGADLKIASLKDANLSGANLKDANLNGVSLSGADLSFANLSGADLNLIYLDNNTNLLGTVFKDVKNLTPEQVKEAKNWTKARYNEEFCIRLGLKRPQN